MGAAPHRRGGLPLRISGANRQLASRSRLVEHQCAHVRRGLASKSSLRSAQRDAWINHAGLSLLVRDAPDRQTTFARCVEKPEKKIGTAGGKRDFPKPRSTIPRALFAKLAHRKAALRSAHD